MTETYVRSVFVSEEMNRLRDSYTSDDRSNEFKNKFETKHEINHRV